MKKLSLYIFLVLIFFSNVNADLNSKDKFIFLCYPGNDQSTLSGEGWEINLKKMTATTIYIMTSGEIISFEELIIKHFDECMLSTFLFRVKKVFISDIIDYIFHIIY